MALKVRRYNFYCAKQYYSHFFTLGFLKGYKIGVQMGFGEFNAGCEGQNKD